MRPGQQGYTANIKDLEGVIQNLISTLLGLAGIALFIMLVAGGFKYITAGGDPKALESAKSTLTYAVIGLVVVACSFLILVVIQTITGVNVTVFNITH